MKSDSDVETESTSPCSSIPRRNESFLSDPNHSESFAKHMSIWKSSLTDKLGIHYVNEGFEKIISRFCLVRLSNKDFEGVEACLKACDSCNLALELDYDTLDDIHARLITDLSTLIKHRQNEWWVVYLRKDPLLNDYENHNRFLVKMDEFNKCLEQMVWEKKTEKAISEWKYQILFEKLLQAFGINTLSQPFIRKTKAMIMGHTVSSMADMLCVQHSPANGRGILCVCEVNKTINEEEDGAPYKKKFKTCPQDVAAMSEEDDLSPSRERREAVVSSASPSTGIQGYWAQHIGELFIYLDKSVKHNGILGIAIDKTWIRFTFLEVEETCRKKVRETPANRRGPVKLEDWELPRFFYSKPYNILKQADRSSVFKGLLLIRSMQEKISKIQ